MRHYMAFDRDVCLACGKTAVEIVDSEAQSRCYGALPRHVAEHLDRLSEAKRRGASLGALDPLDIKGRDHG